MDTVEATVEVTWEVLEENRDIRVPVCLEVGSEEQRIIVGDHTDSPTETMRVQRMALEWASHGAQLVREVCRKKGIEKPLPDKDKIMRGKLPDTIRYIEKLNDRCYGVEEPVVECDLWWKNTVGKEKSRPLEERGLDWKVRSISRYLIQDDEMTDRSDMICNWMHL